MADLSALFQAMGLDQAPDDPFVAQQRATGYLPPAPPQAPPQLDMGANPLAALGIGPQVAPDLGPQPVDPLAAAEAEYQKKYEEAMAKWNAPPQSMLNQNIADFNKYADQRYQQKFGGSKLGVANAFLQAVLAGTKGKTLTEINDEAAKKDWDEAMKLEAQRIAQEKNTAATQAAFLKQQLDNIKSQRMAQQAAQRDETANKRIDVNSPEAKAATEKKRIDDIIQHYIDIGEPLPPEGERILRANGKLPPPVKDSDSIAVAARKVLEKDKGGPLSVQELIKLNKYLRYNPYDINTQRIVVDSHGEFQKVPINTSKPELPAFTLDGQQPPTEQQPPVIQKPSANLPQALGGPKPQPKSTGTGIFANVAPPASVGDQISSMGYEARQAKQVLADLTNSKSNIKDKFGPLSGLAWNVEVNQLGGKGATPDQIKMAVNLQRLLNTESFANGGKQLTPTELERFKNILPRPNETFESAVIKTREAIKYLRERMQARFDGMSEPQRNSIIGNWKDVLEEPSAKPKVRIISVK